MFSRQPRIVVPLKPLVVIKSTHTANIAYSLHSEHLETIKVHRRKKSRKSKGCRSISDPENIFWNIFNF